MKLNRGFVPLATILILSLVGLGTGYFGSWLQESVNSSENIGAFNTVGGKNYYLYGGGIGSSDTSVTLTSFKIPVSDYVYEMTNHFGEIGYVTVEPGSSTRQEFISFSGITQNSDGTATLTGVVRGLAPVSPYTASTTLQKAHPGGSVVVISNPPQLYEQFATRDNDETIYGEWNFASTSRPRLDQFSSTTDMRAFVPFKQITDGYLALGTTSRQTITATTTYSNGILLGYTLSSNSNALEVASKKYVDDTNNSGAADASQTVKGIVEEATGAEILAGTATGGTSARLFMNPTGFLNFIEGTSTINRFGATSTSLTVSYSTTTALKTGNNVLIWGSCYMGFSNNVAEFALYVKPASTATSSALAIGKLGGGAIAGNGSVSVFGIYTAAATENHEIYLGINDANKRQTACTLDTSNSIGFIIINR